MNVSYIIPSLYSLNYNFWHDAKLEQLGHAGSRFCKSFFLAAYRIFSYTMQYPLKISAFLVK